MGRKELKNMKFVTNIPKQEYDTFVQAHEKSHFLQSYDWGEFAKKEKNLTPHYVGLKSKNTLVAAALLLEKHLPLQLSYFYAPRGFVIDFNDTKLLKTFVEELKKYVKQRKAIFIKIDPDLIIQKSNYLEEQQDVKTNSKEILKTLKTLGFKHLGFTKNFETMQPRYSFRIDMNQSMEEIYEHFSKTTKQRIKKAEDLDVEVTLGKKEDLKEFYKLMKLTENRKDFVTHNLRYYETLYDIFKKEDKCNLFIGKVNIKKMIEKKEAEFSSLKIEQEELQSLEQRSKTQNSKLKELDKRISKLEKDIEEFTSIQKEYGNEIILNGHFIIEYGTMAWVLYAGNHNILTDTYANYKTYYEHIKYYHNKVKTYDQFGTIGDLRKENPLLGLHEFKKKFGGDYVEFIGEFDLILKPFYYFLFTKLVPFYRNFIKMLAKKKNRRNAS